MATKKDDKARNELTCITPVGVANFVHIWEPHAFEEGKPGMYRMMLVFDSDTDLSELKKVVGKAIVNKWGEAEGKSLIKRKKLKLPFRDGIEYEQYGPPFVNEDGSDNGSVFISVSSNSQPGVVDARVKPIIRQQDFYAGCLARASVYAHAFDTKGSMGVTLLLSNVQKTGDGEPLGGGRSRAEDEFEALEGGDDDNDDLF